MKQKICKGKPKYCKACGTKLKEETKYCDLCQCKGNEAYKE
jgi:hypothetical protein